jgi:hypothetical protein
LSTCPQLTDLHQELGVDIARGLALRTRDEPARDRRRDDREQREPAQEEERGDGAPNGVLRHDIAVPDGCMTTTLLNLHRANADHAQRLRRLRRR